MIQLIQKKLRNRKGFTLIELIVVIAIIGILAVIAVPRLSGLQDNSRLKADAATASQIVNSARMQEVERNDGAATTTLVTPAVATTFKETFMAWPTPQSGGSFVLSGGLGSAYVVTWTPNKGSIGNGKLQTVTEGATFTVNP